MPNKTQSDIVTGNRHSSYPMHNKIEFQCKETIL